MLQQQQQQRCDVFVSTLRLQAERVSCISALLYKVDPVVSVCAISHCNTGVCEINTHPTCATHPDPPIPPYVNVHEHARIECNRRVK
jgi:hypothetical protein